MKVKIMIAVMVLLVTVITFSGCVSRGDFDDLVAEFEAAQRENRFRKAGNEDEAGNWRAIRERIRRMRGANQS